jgi:hypothetical protein
MPDIAPPETSTIQMALTRDIGPGGFMERVQAMLARVAGVVLAEPGTTAYHPSRAFYAKLVIQSPQQAATQAGPQVVMGVNIIAATVWDPETQTSTCHAADIDLESQITTLWNALGGIDTPS